MKRYQRALVSAVAAGVLVFAATALAQNRNSANRLTSADSTFATKAAQGGMAEVKLGQLAKDHASNQAVKDFGQRMIDDHSKANDQMKSIASKNGITLPADIDAKDQATSSVT